MARSNTYRGRGLRRRCFARRAGQRRRPTQRRRADAGNADQFLQPQRARGCSARPEGRVWRAVDPIKPIAVRTIKVKLNGVQTASLTPPLAHLPVVAVKDEPAAPKAAAQPAQTVATKAAETPATRAQPAAPAAQAAAAAEPATGKPAVAPATPI